jgi:hypothetical protein
MKKGYKELQAETEAEIDTLSIEQGLHLHGDGVRRPMRSPRNPTGWPDTGGLLLPERHAGVLDRPGKPAR